MKYLSQCCKAEVIIRNNDINLCSKCHEGCDVIERWDISQNKAQELTCFMFQILFDADAFQLSGLAKSLREQTKIGDLITLY